MAVTIRSQGRGRESENPTSSFILSRSPSAVYKLNIKQNKTKTSFLYHLNCQKSLNDELEGLTTKVYIFIVLFSHIWRCWRLELAEFDGRAQTSQLFSPVFSPFKLSLQASPSAHTSFRTLLRNLTKNFSLFSRDFQRQLTFLFMFVIAQ